MVAAQTLFDDAKQLVAAGKFAEACPKFAVSFKLDPKPGTAVNLANCLEKNGQLASAWVRYLEAASLAQRAGQAEREQYAKEHAAALEPSLSRLSIAAPPLRGLEVLDNGAPVDPAVLGTAVPVDPGKHLIEARAPGKKAWSKTVELAAGARKLAVAIPLLEDDPDAVRAGPEGPPFWTTQRAVGAAVGGVGVIGVAVGAALGAAALSKMSQAKSQGHCNATATICDPIGLQMDQSAARTAHGSTAALAIGGAALAAGAALIITGRPAPARAETGLQWSIGPIVGVEMTGALVRGGW